MTKPQEDVTAVAVVIGGGRLWVELEDGRVIGTPLDWYMPLANATPEELNNYELLDDIIHWPDLDEDLSVGAMLAGIRPEYPWPVEEWRARVDSIRALDERYGSEAAVFLPIHMTDPLDARVTVREIAEDYGLSTDAVYKAIERERLPAQRSGATWLIRRRDAEALWGAAPQTTAAQEEQVATIRSQAAPSLLALDQIQRRYYELLFTLLEANAHNISSATIRDDKFHITAQKRAGITLTQGNNLLIIDTIAWQLKGVFGVGEERQDEYDAVAIQDVDPIWEGYVRQENRPSAPSDMIAVLAPGV
jgi:excisionase family DNA binding protein